jgi:hypothetical protein
MLFAGVAMVPNPPRMGDLTFLIGSVVISGILSGGDDISYV